jgi:hypothetical protein
MCELKPFEKPLDRPDLCVRVFKLKFGFLMEDLFKKHVLGMVIAHINVIEFQKRGLPHAHILLILYVADKPRGCDDYDTIPKYLILIYTRQLILPWCNVCFIINVGFIIRRLRV